MWNFVALWFVLGLMRNSAWLPQHTELAAEVRDWSPPLFGHHAFTSFHRGLDPHYY